MVATGLAHVGARKVVSRQVAVGTQDAYYAALGVLFRLHVLGFDFLFTFFCCLFSLLLCFFWFFSVFPCLVFFFWIVWVLFCVISTEEQLMPACNVLFWNQVIQTNHFIFSALWPLIS